MPYLTSSVVYFILCFVTVYLYYIYSFCEIVRWAGGAMVLGKLPVPGRPTIWITVGQGPAALVVAAGGVVWTFLLSSMLFSPLSTSLWETARYRLKYCLKGPLNPKQPTDQICEIVSLAEMFCHVSYICTVS